MSFHPSDRHRALLYINRSKMSKNLHKFSDTPLSKAFPQIKQMPVIIELKCLRCADKTPTLHPILTQLSLKYILILFSHQCV
jgi:hypothetical protein